jgi:hypothetical protein
LSAEIGHAAVDDMKRMLIASTIVALPTIGCGGSSPAATTPAPEAAVAGGGTSGGELNCVERHFYFVGAGTFEINLQSVDRGNKADATACVEGPSHQCKEILKGGAQVWPTGSSWIVNVADGNQLAVWQKEAGGAPGGAEGVCDSGVGVRPTPS